MSSASVTRKYADTINSKPSRSTARDLSGVLAVALDVTFAKLIVT